MIDQHKKCTKGSVLIEVVLSLTLFSLSFVGVMWAIEEGEGGILIAGEHARGDAFLSEGAEGVRAMRNATFFALNDWVGGVSVVGNAWASSTLPATSSIYARTTQASTTQWDRRYVATETVTWRSQIIPSRSGTTTMQNGFSDWKRDFSGWASPTLGPVMNPTPSTVAATAVAWFRPTGSRQLYALVATANNTAGPEMYVYSVSSTSSAPTLVGSLESGETIAALAPIDGRYVAAVENDTTNGLYYVSVIDMNTITAPAYANFVTFTGGASFTDVIASSTNIFAIRAGSPNIYSFSTSGGTISQLSPLAITSPPNACAYGAQGSYLFCGTSAAANEVIAVNVSNPSSMSQAGTLNLTGTQAANSIAAFGPYIAVARQGAAMSIVNVSSPGAMTQLSTVTLSGNTMWVRNALGNTTLFASGSTNGSQLQVVNIQNPAAPAVGGSAGLGVAGNLLRSAWDYDANLLVAATSVTNRKAEIYYFSTSKFP